MAERKFWIDAVSLFFFGFNDQKKYTNSDQCQYDEPKPDCSSIQDYPFQDDVSWMFLCQGFLDGLISMVRYEKIELYGFLNPTL